MMAGSIFDSKPYMALPGQRGYNGGSANYAGRRNIDRTNNSTGVISAIHGTTPGSAKPRASSYSAMQTNGSQAVGAYDPVLGRRMDSLELRMAGSDQANRALLEQLMKLNQDIKMELNKKDQMFMEEKNQRMRMETAMQVISAKMADNEDRLKRSEDAARENKNALAQLITHSKNIERAITMNQQEVATKKEMEAQKMQELLQKVISLNAARENNERLCYNLRDEVSEMENKLDNVTMEVKDVQGALQVYIKMLEAQNAQLRLGQDEEKETVKISESVKTALEARIAQLQQIIMECQSKINQERKEREADDHALSNRITDCNSELSDNRRKRNADLKEIQDTCKQLVEMSEAEKQKIVVQISAVQTELQRTIDERDLKIRQSTIHRIDELEKEISLECKARIETERDLRSALEADSNKIKLYSDESIGMLRQMLKSELDTLRTRIQDVSEFTNELELQLDEVRSEHNQLLTRSDGDISAKIKVCEARIEDIGDRLRLGMGKLQAAVGESKSSNSKSARSGRSTPVTISIDETERLHKEELTGIREKMAVEIAKLEEDLNYLRANVQRQEDLIEQKLKVHQQAGEDASIILGDKLQQKMDSVTFTQERMKRQIEDLQDKQDKVRGAPGDISDMRDRMVDIESEFKRSSRDKEVTNERLESIEKDLNKVMGRDEASDASGTPSLLSLRSDLDNTNLKVKKVSTDLEDFKEKITEKIDESDNKLESEIIEVKKEINKQEKRTIALKERIKKTNGLTRRGPDEDEIFEDEDNE